MALTLALSAQEQIPRFKSGVDIVQFTVTVTDADRRPVGGLTAADFEVLVDGVARPLAAFAEVTLLREGRYVATIEASDGRLVARRSVALTVR